MRMAQYLPILTLIATRRKALRLAIDKLAASCSADQRARAAQTVVAWQNNELDISELAPAPKPRSALDMSHLPRVPAVSMAEPERKGTRSRKPSEKVVDIVGAGAEDHDVEAATRARRPTNRSKSGKDEKTEGEEMELDEEEDDDVTVDGAACPWALLDWAQLQQTEPPAADCDWKQLFPCTVAQISQHEDPAFARALVAQLAKAFLDASDAKFARRIEPALGPLDILASIGCPQTGVSVARMLVNAGRLRLMDASSASLGLTVDEASAAAAEQTYDGPLHALTNDGLYQLLVRMANAKAQEALWTDLALKPLRQAWKRWYSMVPLVTDYTESIFKLVKGLNGNILNREETLNRNVRSKLIARCLLPAKPLPPLLEGASIWHDRRFGVSGPARLVYSQNNPHSVLWPAISDADRVQYNKQNGYDKTKRTGEERESKAPVPKPLSDKQLASTAYALTTHFMSAGFPAEPELGADGRVKKLKRTKPRQPTVAAPKAKRARKATT